MTLIEKEALAQPHELIKLLLGEGLDMSFDEPNAWNMSVACVFEDCFLTFSQSIPWMINA